MELMPCVRGAPPLASPLRGPRATAPRTHCAALLVPAMACSRLGPLRHVRKVPRAAKESELVFQEAFRAQEQRCELLAEQLQDLRSVPSDVEQSARCFAPDGGGKSTWAEAFEAAKELADTLERDLEKVRAEAAGTEALPPTEGPAVEPESAENDVKDSKDAVKKLEVVAEKILSDEKTLRFIATPILVREKEAKPLKLPPKKQVRDAVSPLFSVSSEVIFERVFIFEGQIRDEKSPAEALAALREEVPDLEIFLQPCVEESKCALLVMMKEDMPSKEFAWWQWLLCGLALLATLISVNLDAFSVSTVVDVSLDEMSRLATQSAPTAASILSVVLAMEAARRGAAARCQVDLAPPVLVPVWPFVSLGCFGAITRQQSIVPNEDANLSMSVSAGVAGYAVSLLLLLLGLTVAPDPEQQFSLNFQILPLVLKLLLRPLLGQPTVSIQPDPFGPVVDIAFPASPVFIGGAMGLVITSLNMLALGRLDGAVLARAIRSPAAGLVSCALLISGSLDNSTSLLYATFAFYAIILQGGYNCPARDAVTEASPGLRTAALALVVAGLILSIPGSLIPGI